MLPSIDICKLLFCAIFLTKNISIKYVEESIIMIEKFCVKPFIVSEIFEFVRFMAKGSENCILATSLALTDKTAEK